MTGTEYRTLREMTMDDDICRGCNHPRKEHEPDGCTALVMTWEHGDTWDEPCGCTVFWAMTGAEYRALRETIGTQAEAAEKLGVAPNTIARREREELMISLETEYAMRWVAERAKDVPAP